MGRRLRDFDFGFLVVLLICFIAVWPFLSRPDLPQATDAELHVFRLAELSRLVQGGEFYPRWSPNFYYGYGYPIFNYYAPLTYYIGLAFDFLPGVDPVLAVKAVFVLGLLLAGLGMYGFVRDTWGRPAGYVAAAVYVYAPYIYYVDPHARGDLAEAFSFALLPLALWALQRFLRTGRAGPWLAAVLAVSAVILSHNLMAMVFFGVLVAWVVWQLLHFLRRPRRGVASDATRHLRAVWLAPLALVLAVGSAAFFWLPVALEQSAVNLTSLIGDGSHFDFRNHFLSIGQLLAVPQQLDWGATEQPFVFALGVPQWILGLAGAVLALSGRVQAKEDARFFVLSWAILLGMMLPISEPIWEAIPLLPYLQFPWRLLGPAVAMAAVLSGVATAALQTLLSRRRLSGARLLPALFTGATLLAALPLLQLPPWSTDFGGTAAVDVLRIELEGRWLGTTSTADFVPATVDVLPLPNNAVLAGFFAGEPPERVNRATLPVGATVEGGEVTPLHFRYAVSTPKPFLLRFFIFDFPGWEARVDGQPVATELGLPEGFIVVPVPEGNYTVDLAFTDTPARNAAWLVTVLAALATLAVAGALWRRPAQPEPGEALAPFDLTVSLLVVSVALLVLLLQVFWVAPTGLLHSQSTGDTALPADQDVAVNFGDELRLIGYTTPNRLRPGDNLEVTLYWKAQRALEENRQVYVHLLSPDGETLVAQSDKLNPADFPTERWPTDKYVRDVHRLSLPADLPPGQYLLTTGLWFQDSGERLPPDVEPERTLDGSYVLGRLTVD